MTLPEGSGSVARWTGLISESVTQHYGSTLSRSDSYGYDAIGRLTSSNLENSISYDANGNVTALRRLSATGATLANLSMSYAGNRLQRVTDTGTGEAVAYSYAYDSSGNLTTDSRNRLQIQNNVLNLPMRVNQSGTMGGTMTYTYLGDGTRVAARVGTSPTSYAGKRYRGSFVYDVTSGGVQSLESVAVSTGRLTALTGNNGAVSFESDGFITDHLGNVAVVVNLSASPVTSTDNAILEQNEYTPFGTKLNVTGLKTQAANRWRYAGKEEQDIAGVDLAMLDFGARYYDSFTCRWNAVDPMAGKYFSMSPYNYCGNDPVNRFDPDGNAWFQNTTTGELYYNPDYTINDVGKGYMNGSSEWTFLANNDGLGKSDSELLNSDTQNFCDFSTHKESGAYFNATDAASTMKSVGMEFKPTEVIAEVTEVTRNISEGEQTISFTDSSTKILSVEKSGYFPINSQQQVLQQKYLGNLSAPSINIMTSTITTSSQYGINYGYNTNENRSTDRTIKQAAIEVFKTILPQIGEFLFKKK